MKLTTRVAPPPAASVLFIAEKCHHSISFDDIARAAGLDRCRKGVPANVPFREELSDHSTHTLMYWNCFRYCRKRIQNTCFPSKVTKTDHA